MTTNRGTVTIRLAREDDALAYRELRLEALRDHPEVYSSDYATNLTKPPGFWTERLVPDKGDRTVMTYFAVHGERIVGTCSISRPNSPKVEHSATIVGMYVQPEWRGLRLGDGLVGACLAWARAHEVRIVKLAVVTTNARAIRCYARCGFQVYGIEPQALYYAGVYYDELLMACPT